MRQFVEFLKNHFILLIPLLVILSAGGYFYHQHRATQDTNGGLITAVYPQDDSLNDDQSGDPEAGSSSGSTQTSGSSTKITRTTTTTTTVQSSKSLSPPPRTVIKKLVPAPQGPSQSANDYQSQNWSGYIANDKSTSYSAISGSWTVPHSKGVSGQESYDSAWIGIGGMSGDDLIQIGTMNKILSNGQLQTFAFFELLPSLGTTITSLTVKPGDTMSASVKETSAGKWKLSITNNTRGGNFSKQVNYSSSHSSAEWIEEVPAVSVKGKLMELSDFGSVNFSGSSTTANGSAKNLSQSKAQKITMINGQGKSVPSAIHDGDSFTVTYQLSKK